MIKKKKIRRVLIANRGEIAVRIIRTCQEMGLWSIAVYSVADEHSIHVRIANESICIGPELAIKSYLNMQNILSAAEITRADAIHPGYGFLSENPRFAEICEEHGLIFIGPTSSSIRLIGDKNKARSIAKQSGLPIIEGSEKLLNVRSMKKAIENIGFPVLLKATGGGGGKGMRVLFDEKKLEETFETASLEADINFNNPNLYVEKYLKSPKHVEVQVLADAFGNVHCLGTRECSMQRKNQKIIEESPVAGCKKEIQEKLMSLSFNFCKKIGYLGAGTLEFLVDQYNHFYFIEMNTRIQVEHPVTEMIYQKDLIQEQILIAQGFPLSNEFPKAFGHALEFRINAENPFNDFKPASGIISSLQYPGGFGTRMDTHIYSGYAVSPFYDSLLGKLIVWGRERTEAIKRATRALNEFVLEGIETNINLHKQLVLTNQFLDGTYSTQFLDQWLREKNTKVSHHERL